MTCTHVNCWFPHMRIHCIHVYIHALHSLHMHGSISLLYCSLYNIPGSLQICVNLHICLWRVKECVNVYFSVLLLVIKEGSPGNIAAGTYSRSEICGMPIQLSERVHTGGMQSD